MPQLIGEVVYHKMFDDKGNELTLPITGFNPVVADLTYAGADVDRLTISGLDNNAYGGMRINFSGSCTQAGAFPFSLMLNGDLGAVYTRDGWIVTGGALSVVAAAGSVMADPKIDTGFFGMAFIFPASKKPGSNNIQHVVHYATNYISPAGSASSSGGSFYYIPAAPVANITSVTLYCAGGNRFQADDRLTIFRNM